MQAKTIMVVDDDPDQAELLALVLSSSGEERRVQAFSDPIRALAALTHQGADLLIADLSMPWIDGKDMVASARVRRPDLQIFLVSGYPRGAEIAAREGLRFFAKPLNYDSLRQAVDEALHTEQAGSA